MWPDKNWVWWARTKLYSRLIQAAQRHKGKMNNNDVFYTATMAKIHADQGNLAKAAEIYRYLLQQEPDRQDLIEALVQVEKKREAKSQDALVALFSEWIDLLFTYTKVNTLNRIRRRLKNDHRET